RSAAPGATALGGWALAHSDHWRVRSGRPLAPIPARGWSQATPTRAALQAARRCRGGVGGIFVDTHLHLEELGDATEVVEQAVAAGVTRLIGVGVNLEQSTNDVNLGHAYKVSMEVVGLQPLEHSESALQ